VPLPGPLQPTVAARAGGEQVWGRAPLQHAAFVGGSPSVRGLPRQRYAGTASLHGSLELRTALGRVDLLVVRPEIGTIALVDAGRVYVADEVSDRWHPAYGGGLWAGIMGRSTTAHLMYVRGEHHTIHAGFGLPF
jgi:outer membrane translocation and assembly module TamA